MSYRLMRMKTLTTALVLSGLMGVACSDQNKGGTTAALSNASLDNAQTAKASDAAGSGTPVGTSPQQIEMDDDLFRPALLTVPVGTKVTWINKGHKAHTVVSNEKLFDSGLVSINGQFSHTFDAPGTYSYHCAPHAKMIGQIIVK